MNKHGGIWLVIIGTFQMSPEQLLPIPSAHTMTEHLPSVHASETPPIVALCSHCRTCVLAEVSVKCNSPAVLTWQNILRENVLTLIKCKSVRRPYYKNVCVIFMGCKMGDFF